MSSPETVARAAKTAMGSHCNPVRRPRLGRTGWQVGSVDQAGRGGAVLPSRISDHEISKSDLSDQISNKNQTKSGPKLAIFEIEIRLRYKNLIPTLSTATIR